MRSLFSLKTDQIEKLRFFLSKKKKKKKKLCYFRKLNIVNGRIEKACPWYVLVQIMSPRTSHWRCSA